MSCDERVRMQAYFDGEVDAIASLNLERHVQHCAECNEVLQGLESTRAMLREGLPQFHAPPQLRARIEQVLDIEAASDSMSRKATTHRGWRLPSFWWGTLSGAGTAAAAGALAFWVLTLPIANPVVTAVLDAHVSSLLTAHLIDVVSTDKHTVKPWFAGRAQVSPVVADFVSQGYPLTGGRVDDVEHQRAAVTVYRHGPHVINVFCWALHGVLPGNATRRGYHMIFWRSGDLAYAAVSDTGWEELIGLRRLLQSVERSDLPPHDAASQDFAPHRE